jgi:deoxyribodipyrimidine photolyase-related protein
MNTSAIVFPHQLFESSPLIRTCKTFYLVEEWLYFNQYNFHKQKIAYHRASMKWYADFLQAKNKEVIYVDAVEKISDIRKLIPSLHKSGLKELHYIDTTDNWLEKRLKAACKKSDVELVQHPQQLFLN